MLPVHIGEVPDFEPRGDCIWICWRGVELYVPIPIARASISRFNRAMDQWHESHGEVLPFRPTIAAE